MNAPAPLLRVQHLRKAFPVQGSWFSRRKLRVHAVDDVSLEVQSGETLGLVGESGCGKSTLARCVVRLLEPDEGAVEFDGADITHLPMPRLRPLRRQFQLIFQDPFASLNPRRTVRNILAEAMALQRIGTDPADRTKRIGALLERVGLSPQFMQRFPRELSGGQRQRIGIARALALGPRLIVADEPVSALDVSVQADILNLLRDLQAELGLTMLFISHDLGVIRQMSDRIGVMYLGKLVEIGPAEPFYQRPFHPYSEALLAAIPVPDPSLRGVRQARVLEGDIPSPINPPSGCRFHTRCPCAQAVCSEVEPALEPRGGGRSVACHFPLLGEPESMLANNATRLDGGRD
jgi:oligopeptide/dipeptide ABC transporter ATP-binding protein